MARKVLTYLSTLIVALCLATVSLAGTDNTAQPAATQTTQPSSTVAPINGMTGQTLTSNPQPMLVPSPPDLNAKAFVLMDANSGKILAEKNMDEVLPPASLTKMMTLYLTSRALASGAVKLSDTVVITKKAWKMGGSRMFVKVGTPVSIEDLIQGVIVDSGNDACVSLAEYIGGGEENFVKMMNTQAQALGMTSTHYMDSTGLPKSGHHSTAHDLAILARALIHDFPQYYHYYGQKWFTYNGIRQPNRNRLLWRYADSDGLKTGHTDSAGFCLVASAKRDGMRLISVILGAPTDNARATDSIRLLEYGFRFYEANTIYQANQTIKTPRIWFGESKTVPVGVPLDLAVVTPRGQFQKASVQLSLPVNLKAPITLGQALGTATVSMNGQEIETLPLVALKDDQRGGWWRRSVDHVYHLFVGWFHKTNVKTFAVTKQQIQQAELATAAANPLLPQNKG